MASAFGEICCSPVAASGRSGGVETTSCAGPWDKLGIEPQLEQRHEYKNAADQLQRTELTPAHRESLERLTGSVFAEAIEVTAAGRGWTSPSCGRSDAGPHTAAEAKTLGWSIGSAIG